MDNLLGVVLCGGESKRMGRDKGLLNTGAGIWALNMGEKLHSWQLPVIWSIQEQQREAYSLLLPADRLIADNSRFPDLRGPLKGLLRIHEKWPEKDLLLVACDMQDLDAKTIGTVLEVYNAERRPSLSGIGQEASKPAGQAPYDFFVYGDAGFFQPFCGIYRAQGLAPVSRQAGEGLFRDFSLQALLKAGRTRSLPVGEPGGFP